MIIWSGEDADICSFLPLTSYTQLCILRILFHRRKCSHANCPCNCNKKLTPEVKADLMEFIPTQICASTSTLPKNIYVYIHEMERENVRKLAPTVLIDWTMMPDRVDAAKKVIMKGIHDKLAELEPELQDEIVIIFNDIPLANAMLGGETRSDNPDK